MSKKGTILAARSTHPATDQSVVVVHDPFDLAFQSVPLCQESPVNGYASQCTAKVQSSSGVCSNGYC
jgi:hypothetical protein